MTQLKHTGILGMKWGVRKSKTPDSADHISTREFKKKKVSQLSTEELRQLATRLQLEKQLKDLSKSKITRGQKILAGLLANVGKKVAKKYASDMGYNNIANVIDVIPTS